MANIQSALGGSNPISLNEYYRGGLYVPTSRTVTVREPTSGQYFKYSNPNAYSYTIGGGISDTTWNGTYLGSVSGSVFSRTIGAYTYYASAFQFDVDGYSIYGVYRTSSSTTNINTGVPSSGTISIGQLYGAENP